MTLYSQINHTRNLNNQIPIRIHMWFGQPKEGSNRISLRAVIVGRQVTVVPLFATYSNIEGSDIGILLFLMDHFGLCLTSSLRFE